MDQFLHRRWFPCKALLSAGVFALPSNQLLEGTKQIKPTLTLTKKTNH